MRGIMTFLFGVAVGAGGMFASHTYHLVRAEDGFHIVPKLTPQFAILTSTSAISTCERGTSIGRWPWRW